MKTTFFNVQHGDAIFIDYGDRGLVRDFGTLSPTSQRYVHKLASFLVNAKKQNADYSFEAMLTHPHLDHYSGFEYMLTYLNAKNFFDISYIPWLDFSTLKSLHAIYLQLGLLHLYIFPTYTSTNQKIIDWIKMAPLMAKLSNCLLGVEENALLPHNNYQEKILWPPRCPNVSQSLCGTCKLYSDIFDVIMNDFLSESQRSIFKKCFEKMYGILSSIHTDGKHENLSDFFSLIIEELNQIEPFSLENVEHPILRSFSNFCRLKMLRDIDDHSIVFKVDEEALFFSDLHSGSIGKIALKHLVNQKFKLMKSAHHGSRFGVKMPKSNCTASKIVHSCGPSPYNYDGPDVRYCQVLTQQTPPNYANDIICTDWNHASLKWKYPNHGYNIVSPKKRITL